MGKIAWYFGAPVQAGQAPDLIGDHYRISAACPAGYPYARAPGPSQERKKQALLPEAACIMLGRSTSDRDTTTMHAQLGSHPDTWDGVNISYALHVGAPDS